MSILEYNLWLDFQNRSLYDGGDIHIKTRYPRHPQLYGSQEQLHGRHVAFLATIGGWQVS